MADLIDRAALLEQLESFRADEKWRKKRTLRERWLRTIGIDIFAEGVKKLPAVDAVEVVRCKDCKDWIRHSGHASYSPTGACFMWAETTLGVDFCSYGERKEP